MIHHGLRSWTKVITATAIVALGFTCWPRTGESTDRFDPDPIAAMSATTATQSLPDATPAKRSRVSVIGDSITYLSDAAVHAALDAAYHVEVNGIPGIKVAGQQIAAHQSAQTQPDVVVINLGTNDLLSERNPSEVRSELDAMAAEFQPTSCVVFVTLTTVVSNGDFQERASTVNLWIREQPHFADWDAALAAAGPLAQLTTDTVHPTAEGQSVMAQLIEQQVDACTA